MILLQAIVAFLLVLGPLVLIHEFGHFIVAKSLKIGVPVFSLGFGPRLFGIARGGTDYRVSAIPLGGYVRLAGDEADENRSGAPEEFLSRSKWERFLVFVAGATFNVVLAFLAFWLLFAVYGKEEVASPESYPTVRGIEAGSVAERAGLQRGDKLLAIAGRDVQGVEAFQEIYGVEIALSPNKTQPIAIERGGRRVNLELLIESDPKYGHGAQPGWSLSWNEDETPMIGAISPGGRAEEAGMQSGDLVLGVGEQEPIAEFELRKLIEDSPEQDLAFRLRRGDEVVELTVRPKAEEGLGRIGVLIGWPSVHRDLNLVEAARESIRENLANSLMLFQVLKRMISRDVPLKSVSGPIGIAMVARDALLTSPRHFIWLLGFFSLQLGILNLLPIPVLDGGHILILLIESVMRRELSERLKERVMQVGFLFLLAFMSVVIYLDFLKL